MRRRRLMASPLTSEFHRGRQLKSPLLDICEGGRPRGIAARRECFFLSGRELEAERVRNDFSSSLPDRARCGENEFRADWPAPRGEGDRLCHF